MCPPRPTLQARMLTGSTLLLSVCLNYQGTQSAVVQDVSLAPQDGFEVSEGRTISLNAPSPLQAGQAYRHLITSA